MDDISNRDHVNSTLPLETVLKNLNGMVPIGIVQSWEILNAPSHVVLLQIYLVLLSCYCGSCDPYNLIWNTDPLLVLYL